MPPLCTRCSFCHSFAAYGLLLGIGVSDAQPLHCAASAVNACFHQATFLHLQGHLGPPPVDPGADQPLAFHALKEGVHLHLKGHAGETLGVVSEADSGRFRRVVEIVVD